MANISNSTANTLVTGTSSADSIYNTGGNVTINSGSGNDTINNQSQDYTKRVTIKGGAGNDYIYNSSTNHNYVVAYGEAGNDTIKIAFDSTARGGTGDDVIDLWADGVVEYANGDGNDTITNYAYYNTGNDSASGNIIKITSGTVSSISGSGNDVLLKVGDGSLLLKNVKNRPVQYQEGSASIKTIYYDGNKVYDAIYSDSYGGKVTGTNNADFIFEDGGRATINAGKGNDTIKTHYAEVLQYNSGDGDDVIYGWGHDDTLYVTSGTVNSIYGSGDDVIVKVGSNNITFKNANHGKSIMTIKDSSGNLKSFICEGTNTIKAFTNDLHAERIDLSSSNYGYYYKLEGSNDKDFIYNGATYGPVLGVYGGAGNDTIYSYAQSTIEGGEGDDSISGSHSNTIIGGAGDDTISLREGAMGSGNIIRYKNGDGNDVVLNYHYVNSNSKDTIHIIDGSDYSTVENNNDIIIKVGTGSITLKNAKGKTLNIDNTPIVDGIIRNYNDNSLVSGTANNDTIYNEGKNVTINAGAGDDSVSNNANYVTVNAGAGDDIIRNMGDNVTINADAGDDYISNFGDQVVINTGDGANTIYSGMGGERVIINAGSGDDFLEVWNYHVVNPGGGKNTIMLCGGDDNTVNVTTGDDTIKSTTWVSGFVNGDNNANKITIANWNTLSYLNEASVLMTVNGGKGNDTITGSSSNNEIYQFKSGDGNDVIVGYNTGDTIQIIDGSEYSTTESGDDIVVKVSSGSITLKNAKAGGQTLYVDGGILNDINIIKNSTDNILINGTSMRDSIYNTGWYDTIDAGDGNDTIYNSYGYMATIYGGAGNDSIYSTHAVKFIGGEGNDTIHAMRFDDDYYYDDGDGDDIIYGHNSSDRIILTSGTLTNVTGSGNDVVVKVGSGSMTFKNAKNNVVAVYGTDGNVTAKLFDGNKMLDVIYNKTYKANVTGTDGANFFYTYKDGYNSTLNAGGGNDTVYNAAYGTYMLLGDGDDYIYDGTRCGGNMTINGGTGNDTLSFTQYKYNVIQYANGDGDDVVLNYHSEDKIQITDGSEYTTTTSGNDVIITVGDGSITLKDAKDKTININVNIPITLPAAGLTYNADNTAVTVTDPYKNKSLEPANYLSTVVTIDASPRTKALAITGNDNDNFIKGGKGNDTLTGGAGHDYFIYTTSTGKDVITDYNNDEDSIEILGGSVTKAALKGSDIVLTAGKGTLTIKNVSGKTTNVTTPDNNLKLKTDGKNVYNEIEDSSQNVIGTVLNDSIYARNNGDSTINAGKGNDTVNVYSRSSDVIKYAKGDGNDVILSPDKSWESLLDITSGKVSSVKIKGDDQIVKVGSGSITLKNIGANAQVKVKNDGNYSVYIGGKAFNDLNKGKSYYDSKGYTSVNGTKNNDYTYTYGNSFTIDGGAGNDYLIEGGYDSKIYGGKGKDTIINDSTFRGFVDGGEGNDYIHNVVYGYMTVVGGKGNDTIELDTSFKFSGSVIQYNDGDGKDVIVGYENNDTIQLMSSTTSITKSAVKGDDVILTIGKGTITLKNMKDKPVTVMDSAGNVTSAIYGNGIIGITGTAGNDYLVGTASKDSIDALAGNDTLNGGKGDDILTGGEGNDTFIYTNGGGKDTITDYSEGEVLRITNAAVKKVVAGSKKAPTDVVFTVGKGTITLKNAVGKKIKITEYDSITSAQVYGDTLTTVFDGDGDTINTSLNTTVLKIDASERFSDVALVGNAKNNTILGSKGNDILTGAKGKDTFVYAEGNDTITDYTAKQDVVKLNNVEIVTSEYVDNDLKFTFNTGNTLTLLNTMKSGNPVKITLIDKDGITTSRAYGSATITADNSDGDTIRATNEINTIDASKRSKPTYIIGNDSGNNLLGGKKTDTIIGGTGSDTLRGNKGNDILTGGTGADVFYYTTGDGKDLITDYYASEGDIIHLGKNTSIKGASYSGNDLILTIGSGNITIQGGADQTVTVIDEYDLETTYKKHSKTVGFVERWFIEDDTNYITSDVSSIINTDSNITSEIYKYTSLRLNNDINHHLVTNSAK